MATMVVDGPTLIVDDEIEEEGAEEWMRLLEGYEQDAGKEDVSKEAPMEVADGEDDDFENMEVTEPGDASALLAAVKLRLKESGRTAQYHEFLTAISQTTVDREAALAILRGHPDLILAFRRCFIETDLKAGPAVLQDSLEDHRGSDSRAAQLVQLVFTNALKAGHEFEEAKMLEYVKKQAAQSAFPRRLVILRGPPGVGKSQYAMEQLRKEALISPGLGQVELQSLQLTHVCSTDDFFMQFSGKSAEMQYIFNPRNLDANHVMNEARVRLAMEIGIEPLYVDNTCMTLWEMRPYVMLADRMGYVVSVVSPSEINPKWSDVDFLVSRNQEKHRRTTDKYVGRPSLEAMCSYFESLPDATDPRPPIRAAERPSEEDGRFGVHASEYATKLPASAILYKLEKLLKEGTNILRYTPPDGKGWGVNGELNGDWHSFREKGDGSCIYDDRLHWYTEDPEGGWTLPELAMLADLRKEAQELPQAELPTATSHPSLFAKNRKAADGLAKVLAKPSGDAAATKQVSRAGMWQSGSGTTPTAVPASRMERFKARMKAQREQEGHAAEVFEGAEGAPPPAKRAKAKAARKPPAVQAAPAEEEVDEAMDGLPTQQEEVSASTFLAAVKARLTEWGKVEQYHEFILALSGTVDAKAAVRILRGHDDLLRVFKRKFAPEADLVAIKAELKEEDSDAPRPPAHPPHGGVKQELGTKSIKTAAAATPYTPGSFRVKTEAGPDGPRPPPGPPVKQELGKSVKGEIKSEDMPRPPKTNPHAHRRTVTIGDDSDEEEFASEASIVAAVKKGREECVAQLAKIIFRRERATHEGARPRLSMVRYASKVASKPRFPRELFMLRGPPGVGKTEYAMQQLADYVAVQPDEELAARLTHVCSADDFYEQFQGDDVMYKFEATKLESYHSRNEGRVRLAMEAGIHPLYVDCTNLRLWEMRPYVLLAERLGYVVTVVEPGDICGKWDDIDFLASANDTSDRQTRGKVVHRSLLTAMVRAFEPIGLDEPVKAIKEAQRNEGPRAIQAIPLPPAQKPMMKAELPGKGGMPRPGTPGQNRPYTPPVAHGKGWQKGGKRW